MVNVDEFIADAKAEIADEIGDKNAVIALSGGVDSSTAAALAYEAIGDQLTPVYVDTGLMRKGETDQIRETFSYMDSLRIVDARTASSMRSATRPTPRRSVTSSASSSSGSSRLSRRTSTRLPRSGDHLPDRIESEGQ